MTTAVTILIFNAGLLVIPQISIEPVPHVTERVALLPAALSKLHPDIVALQEIYKEEHRDLVVQALAADYPYVAREDSHRFWHVNNGLLVLSRFPIAEYRLIKFRDNPLGEGCFGDKGMLVNQIDVPEFGRLLFLNTHTVSGAILPIFTDKEDATRQKQVEQILAVLEEFTGDYKLIAGDFNAGPESSASNYELLLASGLKDAFNEVPHGPKELIFTAGWPPKRIDHLFLESKALRALRVASWQVVLTEPLLLAGNDLFPLSDHFGVLVRLEKKLVCEMDETD